MLTPALVFTSVSPNYREHWLTWKGDSLLSSDQLWPQKALTLQAGGRSYPWPIGIPTTKMATLRANGVPLQKFGRRQWSWWGEGRSEYPMALPPGVQLSLLASLQLEPRTMVGFVGPSRDRKRVGGLSPAVCLHICALACSKGSSLSSAVHRAHRLLKTLPTELEDLTSPNSKLVSLSIQKQWGESLLKKAKISDCQTCTKSEDGLWHASRGESVHQEHLSTWLWPKTVTLWSGQEGLKMQPSLGRNLEKHRLVPALMPP